MNTHRRTLTRTAIPLTSLVSKISQYIRSRILAAVVLTGLFQPILLHANFGLFTGRTDIGSPKYAGKVDVDFTLGTYTVGGGGVNMWFKTDAFHYVWKQVEGDIALAAALHGSVLHWTGGLRASGGRL